MDFSELVRRRTSVRSYDPAKTVPPDVLERILEAGRLAPSAANRQPWTFVLVQSEPALSAVKGCYRRDWLKSAPAVLAVTGNRTKSWTRKQDGYNSIETDLTIAMDHMILAAANEGVGTCWIAAFDPDRLREILALTPDEAVFAVTPLGYPAADKAVPPAKDRKALDEIVRMV